MNISIRWLYGQALFRVRT